jgi:hypothetical protein
MQSVPTQSSETYGTHVACMCLHLPSPTIALLKHSKDDAASCLIRVARTAAGLSFVQAVPSRSYAVIRQQGAALELGRSALWALRASFTSSFLSVLAGSHRRGYDCHSCCDSKCKNRMKPASADVGLSDLTVLQTNQELLES